MTETMNYTKLFTMSDSSDTTLAQLRTLGLRADEARLYLELLKQPSTHLHLAHATGINRTKVYRLASDLEKHSLITRRRDDRGTFLVATDPSSLGIELTSREEELKGQRAALTQLLPTLEAMQAKGKSEFIIHTYEGSEGFKQMLWHELKTKGENLIFGSGTIEDLVPEHRWAERHRTLTVEAGYTIRELLNPGEKDKPFTLNEQFMSRYTHRTISRETLQLENQISIYNDAVATYHWRNDQQVGFEIIDSAYASMMRQLFDRYWQLAL